MDVSYPVLMSAQWLPVSSSSWQVLGVGEEVVLSFTLCSPCAAAPGPSQAPGSTGMLWDRGTPRGVTGLKEAARAKVGRAAAGQGQASPARGQPGDREGRNGPRRCKSALLPQHMLGTELGQSSERDRAGEWRGSTKNLPEDEQLMKSLKT